MRKLIAYTLSAACLVWAASAGAQSDPRGVQPIPRRITGDDGSPTGGPAGGDGVPALNAGSLISVQGHGKIRSPRGALVASPKTTGKADIQFNCSSTVGTAPSGSTHFRLRSGNFDFRATSHDSLVVLGGSIQIGGTGAVNRAAGFRFVLSAIHGATDMLRMRITSQTTGAVVYDNQKGDSDTAPATSVLSNGWIYILAPVAAPAQKAVRARPTTVGPARPGAPLGFEMSQNFPNPFRTVTQMRFTLPQRSHLKLMVLDVTGRQIATLAVGAWDAGSHTVSWSGRTDADEKAPSGVYFVRMTAGLMSGEQRFMSLRKMALVN